MNTKKKLIALALALLCLSALAVGGTMAATVEEGTAHNVITTSGIDIAIQEWTVEDGVRKNYPTEPVPVMPNITQSKIVEVKSKELTADAWIRVKVVKVIELKEGVSGSVDLDLIELDINTDYWTRRGDYYYYKEALKPGKSTQPLFEEVKFSPNMGNLYQESTATVTIEAEAVQVANNGTSALTAAGWPNT